MDNGKKVLLIHNARQLLTMEGDHNNDIGLIEGGSVLIRDGLIEAAGKTGDIEKPVSYTHLTLPTNSRV